MPDAPTPPVAATRPVTTSHHGRERVDAYDWLRVKDDPEVTGYLEAENAYTEERTAHLADLRTSIFEEIKARTLETDLSVPTRRRGYWYYSRSFEGKEYGASCRAPVADADDWTPPQPAEDATADRPALPGEELLLDLNALAEGHEFFSIGGSSVSLDDRLLAYSTDTNGDERYTVRVKDLATGDLLPDVVTGVLGGVTWSPDGRDLYYATVDDTWRSDKVWRHRLGTAQADDELVFHETDGRFWVGVGRSRSDRFLMIASGSKTTTENRFLDTQDEEAGWQLFAERRDGLEHHLEHAVIGGEDVFLVLHNGTGADFELATTPAAPTPPEAWRPLIAHDPTVRLEDVDAFATHLVVQQRSEGLTQLRILDLDDDGVRDDHLVEFHEEVYTVGGGSNPAFDQPLVRLGYTTMAVPASVYDYDVAGRTLALRRRTPVLGGYDPADYEEHRLWATDLGRRAGADLAGGQAGPARRARAAAAVRLRRLRVLHRPLLLRRPPLAPRPRRRASPSRTSEAAARWAGAGTTTASWTASSTRSPTSSPARGTSWTRAGPPPDRIVAEGGSAGGLLMGAVANQAPELFGGIVAQVPFVDALTSMLDSTLPLTVMEYDEWGNPEDDPEVYDYLAGYAPYDNVAALDYPPILAETSLNDTRVLYVEPAKWVARLRATATGRRDFLLKTEMSAGHGGVSGRYKSWHDRAFSLAWILDRMGLA